jgi:hypothetical protein
MNKQEEGGPTYFWIKPADKKNKYVPINLKIAQANTTLLK